MVITRRIEVFICEDDKDLRKSYYEKLYDNSKAAVATANMAISHLYMLDNTTPYLSDEDREKITYLGTKGNAATKNNVPYVKASEMFKGKADMGMLSCVCQEVRKVYQDDRKKGMYNRSLRSFKANMPMPFKAERFSDLRFADYHDGEGKAHNGCFFTLIGIPFQCKFGKDRSNNRVIVERVISGEYKMCTSSIQIDGKKLYWLLCVDIPVQQHKLIEGKKMFAFLGVMNPICCTTDVNCNRYDETTIKGVVWEIGTKEEFNYRRRQIQEAVRRCQKENRYTAGGKGRKKKCQAIERYHEKELNYVDTKLHTYSRTLVDLAIKHKCSEIVLMSQKKREEIAKADNAKSEKRNFDEFVLRNWSYYGLKEKIAYKCKMAGIKLIEE